MCFLDPLKLIGDGKYNLNEIMEIDVTSSYLHLSQDVKGCQNTEDMSDCRTRLILDAFKNKCKCLPFNIRGIVDVRATYLHYIWQYLYNFT